ncbi:retropepsin-like aspartic protease [Nonomuraea sp. NPDC050643]|uniref:retropepsin-like aspartic protease n=1 Tax=Nonomuraea sp. NPDC050643 TaxID=3155660 RepID=UPI0033D7F2E6
MGTRRTFLKAAAVAGGVALWDDPAAAASEPAPKAVGAVLEKADELFASGDFAAADGLYRRVLAGDPDHVHAPARHGHITLLANRLPRAERLLRRVLRLDPGHSRALGDLADALWRRDEFAELAALLPSVKEGGPTATAGQLRCFAGRTPYAISGPATVRVPFAAPAPLPLIEASLNGAPPELFFLDTGALFALNQDYADRLGVPMYGYTTGKTVYGEHKAYQGRVDRLAFGGGLSVGNVPVHTIPDAIRITTPAVPRHRERPGPHGVLRRHRRRRHRLHRPPAPPSPPPGSRSPRATDSIP